MGEGRVHLVRETPLRQARGLEKESKQRGSGEGAQRRVEGRGEKQTKKPEKVKKRKNGRGEGERSGRGQGEVSLVGTPDPAGARRVLSASGVLSICEMQRRFRTAKLPTTRAGTPPRRSSPPLPPHPCSTSAPCSLSSPLPAAPPLVPAKRIRVFSCRFAPFRRKARGRSWKERGAQRPVRRASGQRDGCVRDAGRSASPAGSPARAPSP